MTKADNAIDEWKRFKTPDSHQFEMKYIGPQANKFHSTPNGCEDLFTRELNLTTEYFSLVKDSAFAFENYVGVSSVDANNDSSTSNTLLKRLLTIIAIFDLAFTAPEHYYAAINVVANGSFSYASGEVDSSSTPKPQQIPFIPPKSANNPACTVNPCPIRTCRGDHGGSKWVNFLFDHGRVRHGFFCDGSFPRWQGVLSMNLLTPGPLMNQLSRSCRNLILASGSLAPISSLTAELNLFPAKADTTDLKDSSTKVDKDEMRDSQHVHEFQMDRLQTLPKPLEANHVVDLNKQLLAISIGHFLDGSPLTVNYKNYNQPGFLYKLGDAVATVIERIPRGGVLIFLPSYSLLRKCVSVWDPSYETQRWSGGPCHDAGGRSVWSRFLASKSMVIIEPSSGGQDEFEAKRTQYVKQIEKQGSCILLAVFRGKVR